jgi:hypothetical protein
VLDGDTVLEQSDPKGGESISDYSTLFMRTRANAMVDVHGEDLLSMRPRQYRQAH